MFPPERAKTNGKSHSGHKSQCCISMLGRCVQSGVSWQSAYCCRNSQHINLSSHNVQQSLNDDEDRRKARERERIWQAISSLSLLPQDEQSRDRSKVDAELSVKRLPLGHRAIRGNHLEDWLRRDGWWEMNQAGARVGVRATRDHWSWAGRDSGSCRQTALSLPPRL